jgi:four helix bundle protein
VPVQQPSSSANSKELQELEETEYWLELLVEGEIAPLDKLRPLQQEADELIAILVTCVKKAKGL